MSRYLTAVVEQALWSLLNLGVNLLLIRITAPDQYGAFAFWANVAFMLASLQNALTVTHMLVLPPGGALSPERLPVERLMHAVTVVFLACVSLIVLAIATAMKVTGHELGAPAAALFVPAFLLQQYFRTLAFARGRPDTALYQTAGVLFLAVTFVGVGAAMTHQLSTDEILLLLGAAYGVVGLGGGRIATRGQGVRLSWSELKPFRAYVSQSGWLFLGVTTTEMLTRFYAFAVAGWFGAAALASLSATQLLLRPVPLLGASWSAVARTDLVRRREAGDWNGFARMVLIALLGGLVVAAVWSGMVSQAWGLISTWLYKGKYAEDGWMVMLWGASAALGLFQTVISTPMQVLRAFKSLAIANSIASVFAAVAILGAMRLFGYGGAIAGTVVGQVIEVGIMAAMLWVAINRGRNPAH